MRGITWSQLTCQSLGSCRVLCRRIKDLFVCLSVFWPPERAGEAELAQENELKWASATNGERLARVLPAGSLASGVVTQQPTEDKRLIRFGAMQLALCERGRHLLAFQLANSTRELRVRASSGSWRAVATKLTFQVGNLRPLEWKPLRVRMGRPRWRQIEPSDWRKTRPFRSTSKRPHWRTATMESERQCEAARDFMGHLSLHLARANECRPGSQGRVELCSVSGCSCSRLASIRVEVTLRMP